MVAFFYSVFYTIMSACSEDYDFEIMEFVLSVNIVASFAVRLLSMFLSFLLSLVLLLFVLVLLLLLFLLLHYLFIYLFQPYLNVIVVLSKLPVFIVEAEHYITCTLNDFAPCFIVLCFNIYLSIYLSINLSISI